MYVQFPIIFFIQAGRPIWPELTETTELFMLQNVIVLYNLCYRMKRKLVFVCFQFGMSTEGSTFTGRRWRHDVMSWRDYGGRSSRRGSSRLSSSRYPARTVGTAFNKRDRRRWVFLFPYFLLAILHHIGLPLLIITKTSKGKKWERTLIYTGHHSTGDLPLKFFFVFNIFFSFFVEKYIIRIFFNLKMICIIFEKSIFENYWVQKKRLS